MVRKKSSGRKNKKSSPPSKANNPKATMPEVTDSKITSKIGGQHTSSSKTSSMKKQASFKTVTPVRKQIKKSTVPTGSSRINKSSQSGLGKANLSSNLRPDLRSDMLSAGASGQVSPNLEIGRLDIDISIPLTETVDPNLWTDPRVLVPVDVQALVIDDDHSYGEDKWTDLSHQKGFVGEDVNEADPEHLTNLSWSERRGQGIHLHWALPDSLLSAVLENESADSEELIDPDSNLELKEAAELGTEIPDESNSERNAGLENINFPRLPDRWLVVRTHKSGESIVTKSWIIESDTKQVTRLEAWNPTSSSSSDFDPGDLNAMGPAGEERLDFTATYDCSEGRFTFHDNPGTNLVGPFNYIVCGWYSIPSEDPLNLSGSNRQQKWDDKLAELRWHVDSDAASKIAAIANSMSTQSFELTQKRRGL